MLAHRGIQGEVVQHELTSDASLTMRSLGRSRWILVASPQVASGLGPDITALAGFPTLGTSDAPAR
ncbi:hypothetical protein GCM10007036_43380 [Alsobacter metallidurans]|uniref:Uncharacterized protein n=1 Tax=Alsobacter metallidurans TaxID=340221 RepID=A0A917MJJ5_9HYPH|nr:hypothetical protein GCM10007036_43380 [Alsobacter metallidurans]